MLGHLEGEVESRQASINIEPDLPLVLAHDVTLTQILVNLISNGMKFVPAGVTPRITVRSEKDGEFVRLWIEDNGIGIPSEDQNRIFKVFERLHGADSYPGTGLGLAIVRKGVERMSGQVGVESEVGKGSQFGSG